MLFLWLSKSVSNHNPGLWFTCIIAIVLLWYYRRPIAKLISAKLITLLRNYTTGLTINQTIPSAMILKQQKRHSLMQLHKHKTVSLRRAKRLCTGDGLHVSSTMSMIQAVPQIHYRVTRSGRVYGKYPNKAAFPNSGIQEIH
ncbi:hypothetical protein X777_13995 [Ooceraea biroi]|nr:hypothetical protein X777_13995 [Ooceraea biroi]